MRRVKRPSREDIIAAAIRAAGSIGDLERLAGIGQSAAARETFWMPFCKLPGSQGLDAGVAELKQRIRAQGVPPQG